MKIEHWPEMQGCNQEFSKAREISLNKGASINISFKTRKRKAPQEKVPEFSSSAPFLKEHFKLEIQPIDEYN